MPSARRSTVLAVLLALAAPVVAGCPRTITPAEVEQYGTRAYKGPNKSQTVVATSLALRTLGYDVVLADVDGGVIKTAPKVVQVHAVGSKYSASSIEDALAWTVTITSTPNGTLVRARPRPYRNGQPLDDTALIESTMHRTFDELFKEIESDLPKGSKPMVTTASK
jgi:hypothetical protein